MEIMGKNILMPHGDAESLSVTLKEGGNIKNFIVGDTVLFLVHDPASGKLVLQKTITTFTDGKAIISIEPGDTQNLITGTYHYILKIIFANGDPRTVIPNPLDPYPALFKLT